MDFTKRQKPIWKGYPVSDSNLATAWKRQTCGRSGETGGCRGWGERGEERSTGDS